MENFFVFCLLVGSFGVFIGVFFDFSIIGLALCIIANCLLFMGASVGGMIAFAESLKAAQFHYVSDGKHKVRLTLKFGVFSYTVNVPVTEYNCPNCMENALCPTPTPSPTSD